VTSEAIAGTSKTIFAIGSISQIFNFASDGILNDEGNCDWDKPSAIPAEFQMMYDPVATERMTARPDLSR